ncbi:MAG TPA: shikimate kinase [Candidatus Binataceae bacterium]|nr:shikimate kinase [Candidatus Binataceae bacterium]
MAPRIVITGFMATGKSVVGRALAARLGWRLIDSDAELAASADRTIPEIFTEFGEAHFRRLEREVIHDICANPARCPQCGAPRPSVISTGGGALVDERNYAALKNIGVIVCLTARPDVIAKRISLTGDDRPKLKEGGKPLDVRIAELMEARREVYARADFAVDTSDLAVDEVVERILSGYARHGMH